MNFHTPVMAEEAVEYLAVRQGTVIVDATLGGGGHAEALTQKLGGKGTLIALDLDQEAIDHARARLEGWSGTLHIVKASFASLGEVLTQLGTGLVGGVLMDLGVSQHQLTKAERGFSYQVSGPLNMRMSSDKGTTAYDLINHELGREELAKIIATYGEERWADRIATFIVRAREREPIETTQQLVTVIKDAIPASARRTGPHPARRTFQALRIYLNDELSALKQGLDQAVSWMEDSGRLVCIAYHSLEDRIVKEKFREYEGECTCPPDLPICACEKKSLGRVLTKRPVFPRPEEVSRNPSARSARLRCFERCLGISDRGGE